MDRMSGFWVQSMKIERVLLVCLLVALGCSNERISAEREAAATANWIADWERRLASGESHLSLYLTKNTNVLLNKVSGNPHVESISIRQTIDFNEAGLAELSKFENLVKLTISGEKASNDHTLHHVTACANLEELELECTAITSRSFSRIAKLGLITVLNIETCHQGIVYEDADVVALGELKQLRYLNLNGGASPEALRALQSQLPECFISDLK